MSKKTAIIGGGPVGLYLSILLARNGHYVSVFEKGTWPVDKVCGQGIMPSGVELLKAIGIEVDSEESFSFSGVRYIDGNDLIEGRLQKAGLGVERKVLSSKLYQLALSDSKITLKDQSKVDEISLYEHAVSISTNNDFEIFDYVFICDGLNSIFRKKLELEVKRKGEHRMGARVHFECEPWCDKVEVYWNNGVEAYVTPVGNHKIEIAFLWFEKNIEKGAFLEERLFNLFPELSNKVKGKAKLNDFKAYGPFSTISKSMKKGPIFLVGDAYKFLDGITGEGISLGLKSATVIANNLENFNFLHKIKIRLIYFNYAIWVNLALLLSRNLIVRKIVFKFANKFSSIFDFILIMNDVRWGSKNS